MKSDRELEIRIFDAALAMDTPEKRARYLEEACGADHERRQRIESLLQAYCASDSLFEETQLPATHPLPPSEGPGAKIGSYKLLQQIGEGGMGIVYMAQQEHPVQRRVALKIIKIGMDTRQVVARFEAERQALALMDHPNIAKVFDGGSTESGRPYFVMELVQGAPITEFCEKNKLSTRERIELFMPVCRAIQSAHQKGIIHRDIKPSNVLVTLHHGEPMPKVIDFGVAKATNQRLTEKTLFTHFATMIGTPAYMSPEQAEMTSIDVDTRTDVYSLGILLYELLTGTTPFDTNELLSRGYGEMQRIIAEQEPEKPSTRMSTLRSDRKATVAHHRGIELSKLAAGFKGDIDWIVMKCLEKDRRRRYDTPNELAADLKRHLDHEPVSAAAPVFSYQLQKFYRRNQGVVRAVAAIGVILVLATLVSAGMAVRMSRLRDAALAAQQEARTQAAAAEAVNEFLNRDLLEQADPWNEPDPEVKLRTVVDRAAKAIEGKFTDQPLVEASIRLTLSGIYRSLDDLASAQRHGQRAREIYERELGQEHPTTLKARLGMVSDLMQGAQREKSKGEEAAAVAAELFATAKRTLGAEDRLTLEAMRKHAAALAEAFQFKEQRGVLEEALALHERILGKEAPETIELTIQLSANRAFFMEPAHSVEFAQEATARSEKLRPDHPLRYAAKEQLSVSFAESAMVNTPERRRLADENRDFALRVYGRQHWRTFQALDACIRADITYPGAAELAAETYRYAQTRFGPNDRRTLNAQKTLALLYSRNGNEKQAEELYLSGIDSLNRHFHPHDPFRLNYLFQTGYFYSAEWLPKSQNLAKTEAYYLEAARLALDRYGEVCRPYIQALNGLRYLYSRQQNWRRAAEINETMLRAEHQIPGTGRRGSTGTAMQLVRCFLELGDPDRADALMQEYLGDFLEKPPRTEEEWAEVKHLVQMTENYPGRDKFLAQFDQLFAAFPDDSSALAQASYFHQVSKHWAAAHDTRKKLTAKVPDSFEHWQNRSAAAIAMLDIDDHQRCARELLKRFGSQPDDRRWNGLLSTFSLTPAHWSAEELAETEKIYRWLSHSAETDDRAEFFKVRNRGTLALADMRRGRFVQALDHLAKAKLHEQPPNDLYTLRARYIEVLTHCAVQDTEKASHVWSLLGGTLNPVSPYRWDFSDIERVRLLSQEGVKNLLPLEKERLGIRHEKVTRLMATLTHSLSGQPNAADAVPYLIEAVQAFAQKPPQSAEEWTSVNNLVSATRPMENRADHLRPLTDAIAHAPTDPDGLALAALFYGLSENWASCLKAYQALTREFPTNHWHWHSRSAIALAAGNLEDHLHTAREMLARFGHSDARDKTGCILKTSAMAPHDWSPQERAQIDRLYERLSKQASEGAPILQVWNRGELALTDVRFTRYDQALEHLKKIERFEDDTVLLPQALAHSVAALCYAQMGQWSLSQQALARSDRAIERESPGRRYFEEICRRDYLYREASQLIQAAGRIEANRAALGDLPHP